MNLEPKFSVIIPTYNRLQLLKQALGSVRDQIYTNYEIIVVDDGSTDGTGEYLKGLKNNIRIVSQSNRGPGAARNTGIQEAEGDYVALLDSDDLWFPWTLDIFARAIREQERPYIVGGQYVEFSDELDLLAIRNESYKRAWFVDYIASSRHPYHVGSGTCALRREAFERAKFLEDRLNAEDHDLILQLGDFPGFVRILSPATMAWRRHSGSETGDLDRSVSGVLRLVAREKSNSYPGGRERRWERRRIVTRHTRPVTLGSLKHGLRREAWKLYRATFSWNASLGKVRYLAAFAFLAAVSQIYAIFANTKPSSST